MLAEDILKQNKLKKTSCRKYIIDQLLNSDVALTEQQLKKNQPIDLFDRVTFYRTLKILEEKNIIHRVVLNDTSVKYALSKLSEKCDHVHYHCINCNEVTCGTTFIKDKLYSTNGFSVQTADVVLEGLCNSCNPKKILGDV